MRDRAPHRALAATRPLRARLARLARVALRALLALCALALCAVIAGYVAVTRFALVDPARFARPDDAFTVLDRHGVALRHVRVDGVDRRWVPLSAISPNVVAAVLAAEDADFFRHRGVDGRAVFRAAARNLLPGGRLSGASTISQQLVKRVYGRPAGRGPAAVWAKIVEALRAVALERAFSKDEILEQYLNRVPFGDQIEGVARASEEYFGRPASQLSVAEAALLAGVPQAPSVTEPRRHLARALARRDWVLARMRATGAIPDAVYRAALAERPLIRAAPARPYEAARFVDAALGAVARRALAGPQGGALTTSLDLALQSRVEGVLAAAVDRFDARGVRNGAAIVLANATGEVLAYVGAARPGARAPGGQLDLLWARRQPGSTLKPFVYELLFERGATGATVLDDVAAPGMTGARGTSFEARDFDGRERGPVRARVALAGSLNLAALDAGRRVGADAIVARMRALGFAPEGGAERFGAAVVLGGVDIAPAELARAYMALGRGGTLVPLTLGPALAAMPRGTTVLRPEAARLTLDILADPLARADAFGADLADLVGEGGPFALKTGTSAGFHDAWAAVTDERFTVVVWLGDPAGGALAEVAGFEAAAPAAARALGFARRRAEVDRVTPVARPPVRLVELEVCAFSGLRPGPRCAHTARERFVTGHVPVAACAAHDARGAGVLPARYGAWVQRAQPTGVVLAGAIGAPARGADAQARAANDSPPPRVREPRDGARWLLDPTRSPTAVLLRATVGGVEAPEASWEVDGAPLPGARWEVRPGTHTFVAVHGARRSDPARLTVVLAGQPAAR